MIRSELVTQLAIENPGLTVRDIEAIVDHADGAMSITESSPDEVPALPRSAETVFAPLAAIGDPPRNPRPNDRDTLPRDRSAPMDAVTTLPADPSTLKSDPTLPPDSTMPPDLGRASLRRGSAVSRIQRPAEPDDSRTRDEALFPPGAGRSRAPIFAGGALVLVLLLALAGWGAGLFAGDPGTTSVATPLAVLTPPPTRVPTRRPPDRTPTPTPVARVSPTPERTPTPTKTATPVKTKVAVLATPTPPKASFGTLVVNAKPWARVTLDGKDLGQTPIKGLRVTAGTHRVVLEHPTLGRVERQIRVDGDETEKVIVDFKNLPGEPGPGSP